MQSPDRDIDLKPSPVKKEQIFSVAVLTCGRRKVLEELLETLRPIQERGVEVIVVDNGSSDGSAQMVENRFPAYHLIRLEKNIGVAGRNRALASSTGELIITLDDDILGLDNSALEQIQAAFDKNDKMGALCFRVIDLYSGAICNWCHPKYPEKFSDTFFETTEITEGAVAFRSEMLKKTGLYPEEFFISHEGSDLAARIIDQGYEIHYTPRVTVRHKYATNSRNLWRRYYYDLRNSIWLAVRNYRFLYGLHFVVKKIMVMFFYSLRDGFFVYWLKALRDGFEEIPAIMHNNRRPVKLQTERKIKRLNRDKPGVFYLIRKRFFSRQVRI